MEQSFTQLDILRFIYKETSPRETFNLSECLKVDVLLLEEYNELYNSFKQMPRAQFNPKPSSLQFIRRYSERTALNTTS